MRPTRTFTLIEVVAAVVILAVLVIPLLGARNRTTAAAIGAADSMVMTQLAASKLDELACTPFDRVTRSGVFTDLPEYRWDFDTEIEEEPKPLEEDDERLVLYRVTVKISRTDNRFAGGEDELVVSTLKAVMEDWE